MLASWTSIIYWLLSCSAARSARRHTSAYPARKEYTVFALSCHSLCELARVVSLLSHSAYSHLRSFSLHGVALMYAIFSITLSVAVD